MTTETRESPLRYELVRAGVYSAWVGDVRVSEELALGRFCSLPGLRSEAPRTELYYRLFQPFVTGRSVLDVGCGAGAGALYFTEAASYIGVDASKEVLGLARGLTGLDRFSLLDVESEELPRAEVVVVVDVLGSLKEPLTALKRIEAAMPSDGILCVAEPEASIAQSLTAPVRRAFARAELVRLAKLAGLRVREWLSEQGTLVAVLAKAEGAERNLRAAHEGLLRSDLEGASLALGGEETLSEPLAYELAAELAQQLGQSERTFSLLCEGNRAHPADAFLLVRLAEFAVACGEFEQGTRFASAALEVEKNLSEGWIALAMARAPVAEPSELIALWSNVSRLVPDSVPIAVEFACAASNVACHRIGAFALERARLYGLELSADVRALLATLYAMFGDLEATAFEVRHLEMTEPNHPALAELRTFLEAPRAA